MVSHPDFKSIEAFHAGENYILYRAIRSSDGKRILLKAPENIRESQKEAYAREFSFLKKISSRSRVKDLGLIDINGIPAVVFPDIDGGMPLEKLLLNWDGVSLDEFFPIANQVVLELQSIHKAGVIHRNIKPSNILIGADPVQAHIINFENAVFDPGMTGNQIVGGNLAGDLHYISPEQTGKINRAVDERSDLYSLGIVFYQLLTGKLPFTGNALDLLHAHLTRIPVQVDKFRSDMPRALGEIIDRLIKKDPDDRYQSEENLIHDLGWLQDHLHDNRIYSNFKSRWKRFRRKIYFSGQLYGREDDQEALYAKLQEVKDNGGVHLTLITGESGSGKTALANEIRSMAFHMKARLISGKYITGEKNIPYAGLIIAIEDLLRQVILESPDELSDFGEKIKKKIGPNLGLLTEMLPTLERITGPVEAVPPLDYKETKNRIYLTFRSFLHIFANVHTPLILFLDDMHGADEASLEFIDYLLSSSPMTEEAMWILATSRINYTDSLVPRFAKKWDQSEYLFTEMSLHPLEREGTARLLKSVLGDGVNDFDTLSFEIYNITGGNPLHIRILLESMEADGSLSFNGIEKIWQWKPHTIQSYMIGGIGSLLSYRFRGLSTKTVGLLRKAALIGKSFPIGLLAFLQSESISSARSNLEEALSLRFLMSEFINPTQESYVFVHDLIRDRIIGSLDETEKNEIHSTLGIYYKSLYENGEEWSLFDALRHLNQLNESVLGLPERIELARLNLIGGKVALGGASFDLAHSLFRKGLNLISKNASDKKELHLSLLSGAAHSVAALKDVDLLEEYCSQGISLAMSRAEKIPFVLAKHKFLDSVYKYPDAFALMKESLAEFGVNIPESVTQEDIQKELGILHQKLDNQSVDILKKLSPIEDQEILAVFDLFHPMTFYLPLVSPMHFPFLAIRFMILTLENGLHPLAATVPTMLIALTYFMVMGDIDLAYRTGRIAVDFYENPKSYMDSSIVTTPYQYNTFIRHWKEPLRLTIPEFQSFYKKTRNLGQFNWSAMSLVMVTMHSLYMGASLPDLYESIKNYKEIVEIELKEMAPFFWLQIFTQPIYYLLKGDFSGSFQHEDYSEDDLFARFEQTKDSLSVFCHNLNIMILRYLWGDSEGALEYSLKAEGLIHQVLGMYLFPIFFFYDAFIRLDLARVTKGEEREVHLAKAGQTIQKFREWAEHSPSNHLHKWYMLTAEWLRVSQEFESAEEHYKKAISLAIQESFPNEAALSFMRIGELLIERGEQYHGQHYIRDAFEELGKWGAFGLQNQLIKRYSFLRSECHGVENDNSCYGIVKESCSQVSDPNFLNASLHISRQLQYDRIVEGFIETIVSHFKAKRSLLFIIENSMPVLKAYGNGDMVEFYEDDDIYLQTLPDIPETMIYSVLRSPEAIFIDNALDSDYKNDPVVRKYQIRSVIVLPLALGNELVGILYLEDVLFAGAFHGEQIRVMEHFLSHTAIALKNASLYQGLEWEVEEHEAELQLALDTLLKVEEEKNEMILVGEFAHEIRKALSGAMLVLNHALGNDLTPPTSIVLHSQKRLKRILEILSKLLTQEDLQPILETLRDNFYDNQKIEEVLRVINTSVEKGLNIIQQVVDFSQIFHDEETSIETFDLSDLALQILSRYEGRASENDIEIFPFMQDGVFITSYKSYFKSILENLIQNAFDALESENLPHSRQKAIQVKLSSIDQEIHLHIEDNGVGIRPEYQEQIFKAFFSTKPDTGAGLGLSMVKRCVSNCRGSIQVNSEIGEGSEFTVIVPRIID